MSFKKKKSPSSAPSTPMGLLPLLTRREFPDVLPHQKEMLSAYAERMVSASDVALQLPTGSGKTLVGLLIGEWRRRKFKERVVYLCPTRQLVNQTVDQAERKYGLDAVAFTGSKHNYSPKDKSDYRTGTKIAVTTYSSLFNCHPYFSNPDTVILDDAHAAENYVAKMWSLEVPAGPGPCAELHAALCGVLRPHISGQSHARLTGQWESQFDTNWVNKLPSTTFRNIASELTAVLDTYSEVSDDIKYSWSLLREAIAACHLYLASREILLRPLIPPTWTHAPFEKATQRLYMSATLGAGGDLERLTGRVCIDRIPAPDDFRSSGIGRRFFIFPSLSLDDEVCMDLRLRMQVHAGRSIVLTSHGAAAREIEHQLERERDFAIFCAEDIERSKGSFIFQEKAAAIMPGRFDGIDFPHDECRLLCLHGLPKATNTQERFLMSRMGASALFHERLQTRVLQAAGRCTRALQDRSAVFVTGNELVDYLADDRNWRHFHPELQAELAFGVYQSTDTTSSDLMANFESFISNDSDWDAANSDIVEDATNFEQEPFPAMAELQDAVEKEVRYQTALWSGNLEQAASHARSVTSGLKASELRGYRALWHYLEGSIHQSLSRENGDGHSRTAREQFARARDAAPTIPWLALLTRSQVGPEARQSPVHSIDVRVQVEKLEAVLLRLGTVSDHNFEKRAQRILDAIGGKEEFEEGQRLLGELLGFQTGNDESDGAPDPWWLGETIGIVFEDHAGGTVTTVLGAVKARQAALHPDWLSENVPEADGLDVQVALVTPCTSAGRGAKPALKRVRHWPLDDFRGWAKDAIETIRQLKASLPPGGDLIWRADAADRLSATGMTLEAIMEALPAGSDAMTFE